MKQVWRVLLLMFVLQSVVWAQDPDNISIYYIRPDGGTGEQCTGLVDAPYPGSGVNLPCAWSHPFWALDHNGQWKIKGGDTIIIASGSYMMGYGAPNTAGWCNQDYTYECQLPPLPSGPDAEHPTRLLGENWNNGCLNPPELWGTQRPWHIIDLTNSANVYIACLEITDHSSCVEFHANTAITCQRDTYPYGDWATAGIFAADANNVTLKDLDIHGLASTGIQAGRISNWKVQNVRLAANGWVGWDGDLPEENDSNNGTLEFDGLIVEWNGCGETYPEKTPYGCWAQTAGGYGDGLGTGRTGGHWIFRHCIFNNNTSDGLDLLYVREAGSQIEIDGTLAYGNAGNAIKTNGPTTISNSIAIANCGFFDGKAFTYHVDHCRAAGAALSLTFRRGSTISVVNSTISGHGDCLVGAECEGSECNGTEKFIVANNIFVGNQEFMDIEDTSCYIWLDRENFYNVQADYNIVYGAKISSIPLAPHDLTRDPLLVNKTLPSFDARLQAKSPAIDSGLAAGSVGGLVPTHDYVGNTRPKGAGVDRGAYEYGSSTPIIKGPPFGYFDSPEEGSTVSSSIAVTGWALDDTAVSSIKIYRVADNIPIFIGNAVLVEGARPDIQQIYPQYPNNSKAGWGYMLLTNFLPNNGNGTITLLALAEDSEGNKTSLGSKTIICDNLHAVKPFGAIDTPTQGGTVSGNSLINWGWVLTPLPNMIPTDGSTIDVWVDGKNIGNPTYNIYRNDIATLFPTYANKDGAVGYFNVNTGAYTSGMHTIQWTATDNNGNTDGIGSRYFSISAHDEVMRIGKFNLANLNPSESPAPASSAGVWIKKGYERNEKWLEICPKDTGAIAININELERLEIHFSPPPFHSIPTAGHPTIVNLTQLPIGSYLDSLGEVFYWQPGPGFLGKFPLTFLKQEKDGTIKKIALLIQIGKLKEDRRRP